MKLTPAQREVLKRVDEKGGRMGTSAHTSFNYVSGTCAAALVRKGLLHYVPIHVRGQLIATTFDVEITDEGREVAKTL